MLVLFSIAIPGKAGLESEMMGSNSVLATLPVPSC